VHFAQPGGGQPLLLGRNPPCDEGEDGDSAEDDGRVIEAVGRDGEVERREEHAGEEQVPDERDERQGPRPLAQRPGGVLEVVRRDEAATEGDEGVRGDGRHAGGGHQGLEGHGRREDRAEQQGAEDVHDDDGVARLLLLGHLRNPAGEGQDSVAGDGPDESGGGDAGDGEVE